ncbi:MAG: apolipoprotein N-acyltransferase [Phenylobacterium sp.]|uniref:apolipoprotein N-acyltransferase n=1 Tax=Phenylobacterium sp. TaxID=1871053 RepID=UPI00273581DC|nr:apolipoprotein N-acyltransferase [Phenylobacterium sp.]MDP3174614.1 apolipoprotein N-acyltransferase [Phenylobacterium sp.]
MIRLTTAWRIRLAALAAGLAAGLAHPPFGLLPGLLGYAVMLACADNAGPRPLRSAFFRGWLAGVGYFSISVWWVVEAFMVDAAEQGWMAPFALALMSAGLALFWGAALWLYRLAGVRGVSRVLVFAGAFAALEWLRGHLFTGFPWNLPGETWRAGSPPSQAAAAMGAYGLTWLTVAIAAAPALAFDKSPRRRRMIAVGLAAVALVTLYAAGAWRLAQPLGPPDGPLIRVVQADIDQKDKWRPENLEQIFATYLDLTQRGAPGQPDLVIWPEGALPVVINDLMAPGSPYARRLTQALKPGQTLMMGANRAEPRARAETLYFNSLIAFRRVAGGLQISGVYDKHRLVPFGEFLPLGELATRMGLRSLVHMPGDFAAGPPPRPMTPAGLPAVQPLICYEALFPGFTSRATRAGAPRPRWILNISNDSWFGVTSGPLQHLNLASYRAIEEGAPIVRATPTGVSAIIDARGEIVPGTRLEMGRASVIDSRLPPIVRATVYSHWGDAIFVGMLLISLLTVVPRWLRRSRAL